MKKLFLITLLGAQILCLQAQTILDTAYLQCTYKYIGAKDTIARTGFRVDMYLLIGKKASKFYSHNAILSDSLYSEVSKGNMSFEDYQIVKPSVIKGHVEHNRVYKNYEKSKIIFTDRVMSDYIYEEELEAQDWTILEETKTMLGYNCRKAECNFRGRKYEAWFTDEIPVSEGPYKFNGLAGLIVYIRDTSKHYRFQLIGVERVSKPIVFDEKDYKKTDRKGYIQLKRREKNNYVKLMEEMYQVTITMDNPQGSKPKPYDLIERDL